MSQRRRYTEMDENGAVWTVEEDDIEVVRRTSDYGISVTTQRLKRVVSISDLVRSLSGGKGKT